MVAFLFNTILTIPLNAETLTGFLIASALAACTYYFISTAARFLAFWTPENTWGLAFVVLVAIDMLAGGIFPLNILPSWAYAALQFTPFPYLLYFPVAIFSGKILGLEMVRILLQSAIWFLLMYLFIKYLWRKGLVVYQASGR